MVPPPQHLPGPLPRHPRPRWTGPRWSRSSPPPWGSRTSPGLLLAVGEVISCEFAMNGPLFLNDLPMYLLNWCSTAVGISGVDHPTWWFLSQLGSMIRSMIGHQIPLHTISYHHISLYSSHEGCKIHLSTNLPTSHPFFHPDTVDAKWRPSKEASHMELTHWVSTWGKTSALCKIGVPENWYAQNMASDGQGKWLLKWWESMGKYPCATCSRRDNTMVQTCPNCIVFSDTMVKSSSCYGLLSILCQHMWQISLTHLCMTQSPRPT